MPINGTIYNLMIEEQHSFEEEYSTKCIEANRHNHITATYHLIHKRALRNNIPLSDAQPNRTGSIDRND